MSRVFQVVTTIDSEEAAGRLAAELVERRLAACVQVDGPVKSTYRWQGAVESSGEWRLTIKTTAARYDALEAAVYELHSYDVPELLATEVVRGGEAYLRWVAEEVRDKVVGGTSDVESDASDG